MEEKKICPHEEIDFNEIPKCDLNTKIYHNTALKLHPDKNAGCEDEELIKNKFQKLESNKEYVENKASSFSTGLNAMQKKACLQTTESDNVEVENAQQLFEKEISKVSKKSKEINIKASLYGQLNLNTLTNKGFLNVESLTFSKGKITMITNIPETIKYISCIENTLKEIKNLPSSLNELYLSSNMLTTIDLSICKSLKKLYISKNKLTSIIGLPISLEVLICNDNNLEILDLDKMDNLKTLHCNNNKNLNIKNIPKTIVNLRLPEIIRQHQSSTKSNEYLEALDFYFMLKSSYEDELIKLKRDGGKTIPKCYGCKKNVGMSFLCKDRKYSVYCGGNPPCNWNIVLHRGEFVSKKDVIEIYRKDVESLKEKIIQNKMKTLLKHTTDEKGTETFEKELKAYESGNKYLIERMDDYNQMYFNKDKESKLMETELSINLHINEIQNAEDIKSKIDIEHNKIKPLSQFYQLNQYKEMYVEQYNNNYYLLVQNENFYNDKEINLGEPPSVKK